MFSGGIKRDQWHEWVNQSENGIGDKKLSVELYYIKLLLH